MASLFWNTFRTGARLPRLHGALSVTPRSSFSMDALCAPPGTIFKQNGDVDLDMIPKYVDHILDFGMKSLYVTGTAGEAQLLTVAERKTLVERWIEASRGKMDSVIVHIGAGNLKESQEMAQHAAEKGANAIACVGPTYFKPQTLESYVSYMEAVASAAPHTPFLLYDIDFLTGIHYEPNDFFALGCERIPTLSGMKHSRKDLASLFRLRTDYPNMQIIYGAPELYLAALTVGVTGIITQSYSGVVLNRIRRAFEKGDLETARMEQMRVIQLGLLKNKYGLSIPGANKAILRCLGIEAGQPRLPLAPVPEVTVNALKDDLQKIGFFDWGVPN